MTAKTSSSSPIRSLRALRCHRPALLWMAALAPCLAGAPGHAAVPQAPTALAAVASASPEIQVPAGEPQKLVLQAPAAGAKGPAAARGEGKVAAGKPVAFLFRAETTGLFSIGVSSPQNDARISIFPGDAAEAAPGTRSSDGAIRWSSEIAAGAAVKIVVHTAGAEIPFRVEVTGGPGGL